jgi:hypothetical protein
MTIRKYGRYCALYVAGGEPPCLCVYKRGAREVVQRLRQQEALG